MTRQEKGQVTPALLLAVIGAFALVTMFFVIAQSEEQSSRSDTAADAAALGAGREFEKGLAGFLTEGNPLDQILGGDDFFPDAAEQAAEQYAEANGAEVTDTEYEGFDMEELEWRYSVEVKQLDTLEYQGEDETSEARATVAIQIVSGVCVNADEDAPGFYVDGECLGPEEYAEVCADDPEKCDLADILGALQTETRLVSQS